ncbi:TPA: hypothetical protein ACTXXA_002800 [Legionella anisa]
MISSYFNLTHLISTLSDKQLDYLIGKKKDEYQDSDAFYLEAHIHSNIDWNKEVDALVLVEDSDLENGQSLNSYGTDDQEKIIKNAQDFARKHNIDCYITDSKGNISSYLHRKQENKLEQHQMQKVKSQIWDYKTWKDESFRFLKFRSEKIQEIDSLVKTYESIADKDNLTARLYLISEMQVAIVNWLENKPHSSRASTVLLLLDQVLKEQQELTESLADMFEVESELRAG